MRRTSAAYIFLARPGRQGIESGETRRQREQRIAEDTFRWTRLGAVFGGVAVLVALGLGLASITTGSKSSNEARPAGLLVSTVPHEPIEGAAIYPVPGERPSDYLPGGVTLYVGCLRSVKPDHILARISDGPYKDHWVDAVDIKTPGGGGVSFLESHLPVC